MDERIEMDAYTTTCPGCEERCTMPVHRRTKPDGSVWELIACPYRDDVGYVTVRKTTAEERSMLIECVVTRTVVQEATVQVEVKKADVVDECGVPPEDDWREYIADYIDNQALAIQEAERLDQANELEISTEATDAWELDHVGEP